VDERTAIKALLIAAAVLTVLVAGIAVWLAIYFARMSARVIKTSNETAEGIERSAERIEALLRKQRSADPKNDERS
jgi:hypothetical protein